jgi:glycosyltransferase involved in cell wall biosynthesis
MNSNSQILPLVSVYMPSKNRGPMLSRAIDSVLAQTYANVELVIVDDGSTDGTPALLADYQRRFTNVRYYRNETSNGVAAARNEAIKACHGEYIAGLDDDDEFCVDRISSLMAAYDDNYAFVCSAIIWDFGHRTQVADGRAKVFDLSQQLSYNHATSQVLVKRERMLAISGFDTRLTARIDYDAWTRLVERYGKALRIAKPSYILSRNDGVERITTNKRAVEGNIQFLAKHRHLMDQNNITNQLFWQMYIQRKPFGLRALFAQLRAGYCWIKIKYFLRINFFANHKR